MFGSKQKMNDSTCNCMNVAWGIKALESLRTRKKNAEHWKYGFQNVLIEFAKVFLNTTLPLLLLEKFYQRINKIWYFYFTSIVKIIDQKGILKGDRRLDPLNL